MDPRTPTIARDLRMLRDPERQLERLAGAYGGATAVIVTCGPSLDDHEPDRLRSMLEGTLTIAVKQAIDVVGEQADLLCYNLYNVRRYRRPSPHTIQVFSDDPDSLAVQFNRPTMRLPLKSGDDLMDDSVAATGRFDEFRLNRSVERPRGPGIMFETVFFLAQHLGVARIVTVGWDVAAPDGTNRHFSSAHTDDAYYERLSGSAGGGTQRRRLGRLERPLRIAKSLPKHLRGQTFNRARMQPGEAELVAQGSERLTDWLAECGVELDIVSDRSLASSQIPRWTLDELEAHLARTRSPS